MTRTVGANLADDGTADAGRLREPASTQWLNGRFCLIRQTSDTAKTAQRIAWRNRKDIVAHIQGLSATTGLQLRRVTEVGRNRMFSGTGPGTLTGVTRATHREGPYLNRQVMRALLKS